MTTPIVLFLMAILAVSPSIVFAQTASAAPVWGDSVNGLQMSISADPSEVSSSALPSIRVAFRNTGMSDVSPVLGGHCGPGGIETAGISLLLTDSQSKTQTLQYWKFTTGYYAGVGSVYVVPLAPRAEFSAPINLGEYKYFSKQTNSLGPIWKAGETYALQAQAEAGLGGPDTRGRFH